MRLNSVWKLLFVGASMAGSVCAWGQAHKSSMQNGRFEVAVNFETARANTVPAYNFWMQGGGVQAAEKIARHWAVVADVSGLHTGQMPHTTAGLDLLSAVAGPRFAMAPSTGRLTIYGQAMGGYARGSNSVFPSPKGATTASGLALLMGGGADCRITSRLSVRMLDANWLRTALSNGTTTVQNNLRLGSGVVLRF